MPVETGTRLGPYEIVSLVGAGGMGEVYRARDPRIGRDVAVKILPETFAANPDRMRRFEQEARAAGNLSHPNLVTIFDIGSANGLSFIVMELLEGESLRNRLDIGTDIPGPRLPARKAVEYATHIAEGLAAAHARGIVHRDLKPENIFITRDGRAKILDFGLAKLDAVADAAAEGETAHRGTTPGMVLGTIGYMAPEQVRAQEVDHRADIFAFGAIFFEMLSGRRAFDGQSAADTMSAILHKDPPELSSDALRISPALDRIVHRCLEKEREHRFQSAHDLAYALEAVSGTSSSSAAHEAIAPQPRRRWLLPAAVLIAAVAIASAFVLGRRITAVAAPPAAARAFHLRQLTFQEGAETFPSISRDGNSFLYVAETSPGNSDIFLQRVGGENSVNLTGDSSDSDTQPAFSPDGQQIAFRVDGAAPGIYVMGATGESRRRLTDFGYNPAWTPDSKQIIVGTEGIWWPTARNTLSSLWRIDAQTGEKKRLDTGGDAVQPACSPHGKQIAFWGLPTGTGRRVIYTMPAAGGKRVAVVDDGHFSWNPVWSSDGKWLYFDSDRGGTMNVWRIPVDEDTGQATGPAEPITTSAEGCANLSVSGSGALVFYAGSPSYSVERIPLDLGAARAGQPARILSGSRQIWQATPSPDGEWLLIKAFDAQEDLFVAKSDGSGLRRLTNDIYKDREAEWSPDSKRLYSFSDRSGRYEIWRINRDGSGLEQITRSEGENPGTPVVSPDESHIACFFTGTDVSHATGIYDLRKPIGERKPEWLPPIERTLGFFPNVYSPDGKMLAGTGRTEDDFPGVYVYSFAEKTYRKLAERGTPVGWLPDSRSLLVSLGSTGAVAIAGVPPDLVVIDIGSGHSRKVSGFSGPLRQGAVTRDGKNIYDIRSVDRADIWMLTSP